MKIFSNILVTILFFVTCPTSAQWVSDSTSPVPTTVYAIATDGANLYATCEGYGLYVSTDDGMTWFSRNGDLPDTQSIRCLLAENTLLFAGTFAGVFKSTDKGEHWIDIQPDSVYTTPTTLLRLGNNLYAGFYGYEWVPNGGVYRSTNNGTSWTAMNNGLTDNNNLVWTLTAIGNVLFVGTNGNGISSGGGVLRSTDFGASWQPVNNGLTGRLERSVRALTAIGSYLFAGTDNGLFLTTDSGDNWARVDSGITNTQVVASIGVGGNLFAGTNGAGIFLSTNNGLRWSAINEGMSDSLIRSFVVHGENLFAGTYYHGVWHRPLSEMITSVREVPSATIPDHYELKQNFPNPFNPSTLIKFSLPQAGYVTLKIFNLLGEEIETLVSQHLAAGSYSSKWIANELSSGVYVYRLQVGSFLETKKLLLLK